MFARRSFPSGNPQPRRELHGDVWRAECCTLLNPMKSVLKHPMAAFIALLLAAAMGCGEPQTLQVVGRVTWHGKPVPNATVVFANDLRDRLPAAGVTDADGRYSLQTYIKPDEALEGAFPGDYGVAIAKFKRPLSVRIDAELARRQGWPVPPFDDEDEVPVDDLPVGDALDRGFRAPSRTELVSGRDLQMVRDILSLTDRDLQQLSDRELMTLRAPPPWPLFDDKREAWRLATLRAGGRPLLPIRYAESRTSQLRATVERGVDEPLVFNFELED